MNQPDNTWVGRRLVLLAGLALPATWLLLQVGMRPPDPGDPERTIRLFVGLFFAALILVRRKADQPLVNVPGWLPPLCAVAGAAMAVAGIVLSIRLAEWSGVLLISYACLQWAMPRRFARDIPVAVLMLLFILPPPGRIASELRLTMQYLSTQGAEWLLHCMNQRVWADGAVLRTGTRAFGVPEACSGMTAATTVLVSILGVSLLLRSGWRATTALLTAGLGQVLVLNIARIVVMVRLAPTMPREWAESFLHDSIAVFLIIAVALAQFEAASIHRALTKRRKIEEAIRLGLREPEDLANILPPFWKFVSRWRWAIVLCVLLIVGSAAAAYKRRPSHRAEMIAGIVEDLARTDPARAEAAARESLRLGKDNPGLRSQLVRVLLLRREYDRAMEELALIPEDSRGAFEAILQAWALMGKKRLQEAIAVIDALPASQQDLPDVAIIRAEFGVTQNDTPSVVKHVAKAASFPHLIDRVRAIFPYLANHQQWQTIVQCDRNLRYRTLDHALIAATAYLRLQNTYGASRVMKQVVADWPDEPQTLGCILALAMLDKGGQWEDIFARGLTAGIDRLDQEQLANYLQYCFRLNRPEIGWQVFMRLRELDPADPSLPFALAQFGDSWLTFRKHRLGIPDARPEATVNLRPLHAHTGKLWLFGSMWQRVPLIDQLSAENVRTFRDQCLRECLASLEAREKRGALSPRLESMLPTVLAMAGRIPDALAVLAKMERNHPQMRHEILGQRLFFYELSADWHNLYETARARQIEGGEPILSETLAYINALLHLDLGVFAEVVARRAATTFPDSRDIALAKVAIWHAYGFYDQALFAMRTIASEEDANMMTDLYWRTQRLAEAKRAAHLAGKPPLPLPPADAQALALPAAEFSLVLRCGAPLTLEEMDRRADQLEAAAQKAVSPFIKNLQLTVAEWFRNRGSGRSDSLETWQAVGRDPDEQAVALNELVLLSARQGRIETARKASDEAVRLMPFAAGAWRLRVALYQGDWEILRQARAACPDDPEIWLAELVSRTVYPADGEKWAKQAVEAAVAVGQFPCETMVRAAEFLMRNGMHRAAAPAAHDAVKRASGFLPAYVAGIRSSIFAGDLDQGLAYATVAVDHALDPRPFYDLIVAIKREKKSHDSDVVAALEALRAREPNELKWVEQLSSVCFERGDMQGVLNVLGPVLRSDRASLQVGTLLLGAEAARLDGQSETAVRMLETTYGNYPANMEVLNNLVYVLAQDQRTISRAMALLPKMMEGSSLPFFAYDTAALVCLKAGEIERAGQYSQQAVARVTKDDYAWSEVYINAADISFRLGQFDKAREYVAMARTDEHRPQIVERRAADLDASIRRRTGPPQP